MNTIAPKSAHRWYHLRWWYVLVLVVLIPFVFYLQHQIRGERELARVLAAWDAEGRWRWEQALADRPALADDENLAVFMGKMAGAFNDSVIYLDADLSLYDSLETHPQHLLSNQEIAVLKRRHKDAEGFFALLPRFRQMTNRSCVEIDSKRNAWSGLFLFHIQEHRNVINRMNDQFRLELMEGHSEEAFALLMDQLKVADSLNSEANIICYLVQIALRALVTQNVHYWLALSEPNEAELEYMQRALADTDSSALWRKVIMAEAGANYSVLMQWQQEPSLLDKAFNFYPSGKWWEDPLAWGRAYYTIQQLRSPWQYAAFMQWMLDAYHQTGQPLSEQKRWFKENSEKIKVDRKKDIHSLAGYLSPALDKVLHARLKLIAHARCAQIALAAERFRRANQRWPNSQTELVGKYLTAVLLDPFDDQPIRYKLLPDGVVIYSIVGISPKDDSDDGGDVLSHDNENRDRPKDLGIRLWDVAQRRQPARVKPQPIQSPQ